MHAWLHTPLPKSHIHCPPPLPPYLQSSSSALSKKLSHSSRVVHFFLSQQVWWPQRDPQQTPLHPLNSTRTRSLGISKGPLYPSVSSVSPDEFGWISSGLRSLVIGWQSEFYLMVDKKVPDSLAERHRKICSVERHWVFWTGGFGRRLAVFPQSDYLNRIC